VTVDRRFLVLFAATITLGLLAFAATRAAADGAGPLAAAAAIALGLPAALGLAALVRLAYLDGRASARRREAGRRS